MKKWGGGFEKKPYLFRKIPIKTTKVVQVSVSMTKIEDLLQRVKEL